MIIGFVDDAIARGVSRTKACKTEAERKRVIEVATSPEFRDLSPKQIVALVTDDGVYIASGSSFYRILREEGLVTHRNKARPARASRPMTSRGIRCELDLPRRRRRRERTWRRSAE